MNELQTLMNQMKKEVAENLTTCCLELQHWRNTGILCNGLVRGISYGIREVATGQELRIVESEIMNQAMDKLVAGSWSAHPDNDAVDKFAFALKTKLAECRVKGKGGWNDPNDCGIQYLIDLFHTEVLYKKDIVDIGNYAMMLFNRGVTVLPTPVSSGIVEASEMFVPFSN